MSKRRLLDIVVASALSYAAGCDTPMSMFSDASDSAARVSTLAWLMIIVSSIIFVGVMATMVAAMVRNRRASDTAVDLTEPGNGWILWGGAVMPGIVLLALFVIAMGAMGRYPEARPVVTIHVTGEQWWWRADYELPGGRARFLTANELHVPVGQPVRLLLTTADVIHSFWVPQLQGKLDVIPGDTNDLRIVARRAGRYAGNCAEFCGVQHAHMGITIVADDPATFARWSAQQRAIASPPRDSTTALGQRLFLSGPCAGCHTVRGTTAAGQMGPDLTHVGSRATLAAGALGNTLGGLEGWIANAQAIKPGVKMPTLTMYEGDQLRALAAYLESLR